jgi:hypothetical protein
MKSASKTRAIGLVEAGHSVKRIIFIVSILRSSAQLTTGTAQVVSPDAE